MSFLNDDVRDDGLQVLTDATSKVLHICSAEPTSRAEAISLSLGSKTSPTVGAPQDGDTNGRKVVISAITDGSVTVTGTAAYWALIDGTRLLATQALASTQAVTNGNPWTLAATDITIPD